MRFAKRSPQFFVLLAIFFLGVLSAHSQRVRGELDVEVRDPQGAGLAASVELVSQANQVHRTLSAESDGRCVVQDLPFGIYKLTLSAEGFAPWANLIEIRSEVPIRLSVKLGMEAVTTQVQVSDLATLIDPYRTGTLYPIGKQAISESLVGQPGRQLSNLVDELPGWLYEANGVLHPRGSEYDVQYVVDGLPITENRSPAFAPPFDADHVDSMRVLTANYPAEYGRKLGGIVEVIPVKNVPPGLHGQVDISGGSFATLDTSAEVSYVRGHDRFSISGDGFHTDRYLDPPVLANYTNRSNAGGVSASYERDFLDRNRLRLSLTHDAVRFLVPNELVQQLAGQRQDVTNVETSGQVYFQHTISPDLFLSISGSIRDATATLASNRMSSPIVVAQDRGYREGYGRGDLAGHHGHHDWKLGVDSTFSPVHEQLQYTITDPKQFDSRTQQHLEFSDQRWDIEPSSYAQDQIHIRNWNISAGLRFDRYGFIVHESALSPRFGLSRYLPSLNLLIHASFDRVFQTPAVENLLLASSRRLDSVNPVVVRLPVRPARANYYEVGVTKAFRGRLRLDANVFRRDFRNYSDDDVLLDTGVSFPIAFSKARIVGEELRLELPHLGRFSGYLSYANQSGIGQGPITGGLLLGSEAGSRLNDTTRFAVSQDQHNTARGRMRFQAVRRLWLALGGQYGSGLPADVGGADPNFLLAQYGAAILDHVNLDRGRVLPSFSVDAAAGLELYQKETRSASLQIYAANLADRVNVINFASLFSGTAVAPPRSFSVRLKLTF
jgi:hypothetical protein